MQNTVGKVHKELILGNEPVVVLVSTVQKERKEGKEGISVIPLFSSLDFV